MKKSAKLFACMMLILTLLNINISDKKEEVEAAVDVGICDQITANGGHNDKCGEGQITFLNSSFEEPQIEDPEGYRLLDENIVPGWETTNSRNVIEVWSSPFSVGYTGAPCQEGHQCAEINATEAASLYQDFEVKPGQYVYYSFYHMGRASNNETLELRMGKPNDASGNKLNPTMNGTNDTILVSTAQKGVWTKRYGVFQVPEDYASDGSNTLRIAFLATSTSSVGNLIDNIEFYTVAVYDNDISISNPAGGLVSPATDVFEVSNTLKYFDRDVLASDVSSVTYNISDNVDFVDGSLKVEGVSHSDYTYSNNVLTVNNLPEVYEDLNITYDVKFKGLPNVAQIQISSYFEYASKLVYENYPTSYNSFDVKDNANLNVSYALDGYCDLITASNGYSDDCSVATNTVYDNEILIIDNQPTQALGNKTFTIENNLVNLNTDKEMDESTSTLKYTYKSNMNIDFSTLKINGVAHTDYVNNPGVNSSVLEIKNIPDQGVGDYKITFDMKYDFTKSNFLRDIFVKDFLISSMLTYENDLTSSYVSDIAQINLSYATNITITNSISDISGNSLLATGETLSSEVVLTNDSPIVLSNVIVNLITDTTKLETNLSNVVVKSGPNTLVLGSDYTIANGVVTLNSMQPSEVITIGYDLTALDSFLDSKALNNTVSAVADEFTSGIYQLQTMNIDILGSTSVEVNSSVVDNQNGLAGNKENLVYTLTIENTGSFNVSKLTVNDLVNSSVLNPTITELVVKENTGAIIASSNYTYTNDNLVINHNLVPGKSIIVTFKAKTIDNIGTAAVSNTFNVVATASNSSNLDLLSTTATMNASQRPTITGLDFVSIDINTPFNLTSYVSANDAEDGNISSSLKYTPTIDTTKASINKITISVLDSDNRVATKTMVVVVDDGNVAYSDTKVLYAKNFERYVSQVVVDPEVVKLSASVYVFDKATGEVTTDVVNVNMGQYKPVAGSYPIVFSLASDPSLTRTITATVKSSNPPSITGATFIEVNVGDSFDPMSGVSSLDDFDGNITNKIVVSGSYDLNTAGIYKLTYSVVDSDNNTTTVNRILLVNDGTYSDGVNYIIKADDFTKRVSQVVVNSQAVTLESGTKVYDKKTGLEVSVQTSVVLNDYTNIVGQYNMNVYVTNDSSAAVDIVATVVTGDFPVLTSPSFTEVNVGEDLNLKTGVSADDTEEGDLTAYITYTGSVDTKTAGIYVIEYRVVDIDGNVTTAKRVVVVNDGSFAIGDTRIIQAYDFYKLTTDVDTSDSAIIADASAVVYDKSTGLVVSDVLTINNNGYSSAIDVYPIEFSLASDLSVTKTINADVSNGHDPVINFSPFLEIPLNSSFDPLFEVSATDIEDGDLTSSIGVVNPVDTSQAGVYVVEYSVTDSTGNTTNETMVVLVNDGNYVAGTSEIIYAKDFSNLISEVDTSDAAIIGDAATKLYSKATGDLLGSENIVVNAGAYTNVQGNYNITFTSVNDSTTTITIIGTVSQGSAPILTAEPFVEVSVGDEIVEADYATATDAENGDISTAIIVSSNVDTSVPGFYTINYSVQDFDGNEDVGVTTVLVNDGSYAVGDAYVIYATDFTKRVSEVSGGEAEAVSYANVKAYNKLSGAEIAGQYISVLNGYTSVAGEYDINFTLRRDNTASITITATVESGNAPVVNGDKVSEVALNSTFDPRSTMSASDVEDGDLTANGKVTGTVVTSVPGIYPLVYSIVDSDNNYVEYTRYVIVNDGTYIITDDYVIVAKDFTVRVSEVDTSATAINANSNFKVLDIASESETTLPYTINIGEYHAEEGVYNIEYVIVDGENVIEKTIQATVISGNAPEIDTVQYVEIDPGDSYDIMAGVSAIDIEDGDISGKVTATTDLDTSTVGVYTVRYSVIDSDKNQTTFIKVVVVGKEQHSVGEFGIIYAEDFEKYISQVDNTDSGIKTDSHYVAYSKLTGEELSLRIEPTINTTYTAVAGQYPVVFTSDLDPAIRHEVTATVIGGNVPEITGENIVEVNVGDKFNISDFITAVDVEDGDITSSATISPNLDTSKHGVYAITYTVKDNDNNIQTFTQTVIVNDGYYEIVDSYIIHKKDYTLKASEVVVSDSEIIKRSELAVYNLNGDIVDSSLISIDYNDYVAKKGEYTVYVMIDSTKLRQLTTVEINITVTESVLDKTGYVNYFMVGFIIVVLIAYLRKRVTK